MSIGLLTALLVVGCSVTKQGKQQTPLTASSSASVATSVASSPVPQPSQTAPKDLATDTATTHQPSRTAPSTTTPVESRSANSVASAAASSISQPPETQAVISKQATSPKPTQKKARASSSSASSSTTVAAASTPVDKTPAAVALNLSTLEQRLRETRAIGVFTKLSLKNQVDDLLDEFRAYYRGQSKIALADLRQRYDLLLMKLLSLLQDSDQSLASAIASSREAIWDILRDPNKFAKI